MKTFNSAVVVVLAATLGLSACGKGKSEAPTGQVVATVDGDEITARELQAELAGMKFSDDKNRKAAERQALGAIINRHLLAKAARERGVDKSPDYAIQRQRVEDISLVQEFQNTIVKGVPASTREEAQRYITANPDLFAERKIFIIDQLRTPAPMSPPVAEAIKPLKSIDEVVAVFAANKVQYQRLGNKLDSVGSDPKMIETILNLKSDDLFAVPTGQVLLINQVKETKVEPFGGEPAITYAIQQLTRQHTQEAVMREFSAAINQGKGKVEYAKGYEPPPAPAAAAAPAAAQSTPTTPAAK